MRRLCRQLAVLLLLVLSALAEQHPVRTHYVLDRWLAALGGRAKLQGVQSIYVKAVMVISGQVGTIEKWQTSRGDYKTVAQFGDHEFVTVTDGHRGWASTDGAVQDLTGDALASASSLSYLGSYSQFFPDRQPGSVEWVREDDDAFVIRVEPSGGTPITFYLDKNTGLPIKHEMLDGDRTLTFYYLEWQDYGGMKTFKRGRQTAGEGPELNVTTEAVDWNPKLDPRIFQKPSASAQ